MTTSSLRWFVSLATLAVALFSASGASAQACSVGQSCFYVPPALTTAPGYSGMDWDMVLASPRGTITGTWRLSTEAPGAARDFTVNPGTPLVVDLSATAGTVGAYDTIESRGILIQASSGELIVDHRLIAGPWQSSSTIKSSTYALGTRFRLGAYNLNNNSSTDTGYDYASVYAPLGATVTFTAPPGATVPFWNGSAALSYSVTLAAGETYVARTAPANICTRESWGALVTSTDPIAVDAGGRGWSGSCSVGGGCGDDGADNVLPTSGIGTQYVVHNFPSADTVGEDVRVVADVDGTQVRVDGALVATLDAGQNHRFTLPSATVAYIETSQPAYVYQNSGLSSCEIDIALIPPVALAPTGDWVTDFNVSGSGRVAVVIATASASTLRLDGAVPAGLSMVAVPGRADLTAVQFNVGANNHSVRASSDFQLGLVTANGGTGLFGYFTPFRVPGCGDGSESPTEACDDGNIDDGDGCSATCRLEDGETCVSGDECLPTSRCFTGMCVARCIDSASCDDSNPCTTDVCDGTSGACVSTAIAAGIAGGCAGSEVCSGDPENRCVACVLPSHCPDDTNECTVRSCVAFTCGSANVPFGTVCSAGVCDANVECSMMTVAVGFPTEDLVTRNRTPVYSGVATPGSMVTLTVDGMDLTTVTAGLDGAWMFDPDPATLADGPHTLLATARAGAATASDGVDFSVDTVTTVAITEPVAGARTTDTTPTITGTGEAGATVAVTVGPALLPGATVAGDGTWTVTVPVELAEGSYTVGAVATDVAGNTAMAESMFSVVLSTQVAIDSPADGGTVSSPTPTIEGTGEPGAMVAVTVDTTVLGTVTVTAGGTWSIAVTTALADGPHTVTAMATNEFGHTANAESDFQVDPSTFVDWLQPMRTGDRTPEVSGTGEPGATVEIEIDEVVLGTTIIDREGNWTFGVVAPLTFGMHAISVTATDAGGSMATDTGMFIVDEGPQVEIRSPADGSTTADTTPVISGVTNPGRAVFVLVDGVALGFSQGSFEGAWDIEATTLTPGEHTVTAILSFPDGREARDVHTFTVDVDAPAVTITAPELGRTIADSTPTVSGTATPNAEVEVFIDGRRIAVTTADGDGAWSIDASDALADGEHSARAVARTETGRTATDGITFTVDTTTTVAITTPTSGATLPGPRPTFAGTGEPRAILTFRIDGTPVSGTDVEVDASGRWSFRAPADLAAGAHTVQVDATDMLGNEASTDEVPFTVSGDLDTDGDGFLDSVECPSEPCRDSNDDGTPDFEDPDDDGDGIPTAVECPGAIECADTNTDGTPNYLDPDDDGDGLSTLDEGSGTRDTNDDGLADHLDVDDDGDGVSTVSECPTPAECPDTDDDGTPDQRDPDDDDDLIPTNREFADGVVLGDMHDVDDDGANNWLDTNADGDASDDTTEALNDVDTDGVPDYLDPMSMDDGGVPDAGPEDGGSEDGGPEDAGAEDAGSEDSGPVDDGGEDGSTDDGSMPLEGGGFAGGGCAVGNRGESSALLAGLVALAGALMARRRRRR